jgi:hypothetical protein
VRELAGAALETGVLVPRYFWQADCYKWFPCGRRWVKTRRWIDGERKLGGMKPLGKFVVYTFAAEERVKENI